MLGKFFMIFGTQSMFLRCMLLWDKNFGKERELVWEMARHSSLSTWSCCPTQSDLGWS